MAVAAGDLGWMTTPFGLVGNAGQVLYGCRRLPFAYELLVVVDDDERSPILYHSLETSGPLLASQRDLPTRGTLGNASRVCIERRLVRWMTV